MTVIARIWEIHEKTCWFSSLSNKPYFIFKPAYYFFKNRSTVFALLDMYGLLFLPFQVLSMAYNIEYGLFSIEKSSKLLKEKA